MYLQVRSESQFPTCPMSIPPGGTKVFLPPGPHWTSIRTSRSELKTSSISSSRSELDITLYFQVPSYWCLPISASRGLRRTPAPRPRHARATPDAQPRRKQPEDERPRGPLASRIRASEPACVSGMQHFPNEKQHFRARSLFV